MAARSRDTVACVTAEPVRKVDERVQTHLARQPTRLGNPWDGTCEGFAEVLRRLTPLIPPPYAHLIRYQLMIRLAPEYRRKVTPEIAALARDSMETIINSNAEHEIAFLDRALQSGGPYSLRSING